MSAPLDRCSRCGAYGHVVLVCPHPPRVPEEAPRDHVVNALTALEVYREVNYPGQGWHELLQDSRLKIAELAGLLESVETRLRFAVKGLTV